MDADEQHLGHFFHQHSSHLGSRPQPLAGEPLGKDQQEAVDARPLGEGFEGLADDALDRLGREHAVELPAQVLGDAVYGFLLGYQQLAHGALPPRGNRTGLLFSDGVDASSSNASWGTTTSRATLATEGYSRRTAPTARRAPTS